MRTTDDRLQTANGSGRDGKDGHKQTSHEVNSEALATRQLRSHTYRAMLYSLGDKQS